MKQENPRNWISLDLEMNHDENKNVDDIIQIGIVAFDFYTGDIIAKERIYVSLPTDENNKQKKVSPFIESLTGITDDILQHQGKSLMQAYLQMKHFVEKHDGFKDPVCWGGNDADYLLQQLILKAGYKEETFGRYVFNKNFFNAKKDFQIYCQVNDMSLKSGLAKSMRRLGLKFEGRIHDALDDAINCKTIFHFLCQKFKEPKR